MRHLIYSAAAVAIGALVASSFAASPASAGVVGMGDQSTLRSGSLVEQVHYRHYWRRRYCQPYAYNYGAYPGYYYGGYDPFVAAPLGVGAAAVDTAADLAFLPFLGLGFGNW